MFKTMRDCWIHDAKMLLDQPGQLLPHGIIREKIAHTYVIEDPRACWGGGGRQSQQSLGLGFAVILACLSEIDTGDMAAAYGIGDLLQTYNKHDFMISIDTLKHGQDEPTASMSVHGNMHQFLVRNNRLHMITTMRSNDLWLGGIYYPFMFCQLQCLAAALLGCELGHYHHRVGSFHMYEKNAVAITETILDEDNNGHMPWVSPAICKEEADELIYTPLESRLIDAEIVMRCSNLFDALALLPHNFHWSAAAIKCMHYHLTRKKKS